jgi:hypothetical protein
VVNDPRNKLTGLAKKALISWLKESEEESKTKESTCVERSFSEETTFLSATNCVVELCSVRPTPSISLLGNRLDAPEGATLPWETVAAPLLF